MLSLSLLFLSPSPAIRLSLSLSLLPSHPPLLIVTPLSSPSPSPPPRTLSLLRSHRRTLMRFVIGVYRLHIVEGTLPPEYTYAVCTRASTCLDEQEDFGPGDMYL